MALCSIVNDPNIYTNVSKRIIKKENNIPSCRVGSRRDLLVVKRKKEAPLEVLSASEPMMIDDYGQ
jgi:hypothetical protein